MTEAQETRALELTAAGYTRDETGAAIGVCGKTISNLLKRPGMAERVAQLRAERGDPSAISTLRDALAATRKDGTPDWQTRVQAARALLLPTARDAAAEGAEPAGPTVIIHPEPEAA